MKKFFTLALLALFGLNASAQEVTFDFSLETSEGSKESVWGFPASSSNKTVEEKSFTYNGYTVKVAGSTGQGYYWNDKDKYLLIGKTGAYLVLPAFSFDVEAIKVVGREGASGKVTQNIYVGEQAVSTETTGATGTNSYSIDNAYQAAGNIYVLKVTNNNNTQVVKIEVYKKGSGTKQNPGLSWGTGSKTVTIGADDNIFPTLTNPNSLAVTYDSSNKECATISEEGAITLVAAGKTDISAEFAGNDEFEAQTVKYTLTVKAAPKAINVQEALAIVNELEAGKTTDDEYIVTGFVVGNPDFQRNASADNVLYGNVNFTIANEEGGKDLLTVFRAKNIGNVNFTEETINKFKENDKVEVFGKLQQYVKDEVTTPQLTSGYLVSVTPAPKDVTIAPESGDISAALEAALGGAEAKSVTINLKAGAAYTITKSITSSGNVAINGNGATVDASALTVPMIQMNTIPTGVTLNAKDAYEIGGITIKDLTITGIPYQLIYGNKQKYLMAKVLIDDCVIGVNGKNNKTIIDFNGGGNASEIIINKSTLWANPSNATNGGLFSSQSGHGSIQDLGSEKQLFAITNSTIYNIASGKTTSSQRRNNTVGMEYKVENSIIVNSGKSGQFIVGLNGGNANAAQTYTISGNAFNFGGADVSAAEQTKVQEKVTDKELNSVAGVIAFTDADNGDFNGTFTLAEGATKPEALGDARWSIEFKETATGISTAKVAETQDAVIYNVAGQKVNASYKGLMIMNGRKFMNK